MKDRGGKWDGQGRRRQQVGREVQGRSRGVGVGR